MNEKYHTLCTNSSSQGPWIGASKFKRDPADIVWGGIDFFLFSVDLGTFLKL
jgi:hypothetical protein